MILLARGDSRHAVTNQNAHRLFRPAAAGARQKREDQYMRANWLSNRVFDHYDAIVEAACEARKKLTRAPDTIRSIGMRDWAHVGWSE